MYSWTLFVFVLLPNGFQIEAVKVYGPDPSDISFCQIEADSYNKEFDYLSAKYTCLKDPGIDI